MVRKAAKKAESPTSVIYPEGCEPIDPETNNSRLALALKALYERISEDETITDDNFESLATHLVSSQLINKPADVSVYVALCLARIFIICPTNPFELKNEELRDALDFLSKSLGRIRCESEALYTRYHSLLEMVSNSGILQQNLKQLDSDTDDGARVVATLLKSAALIVEVRKAVERVQEESNEQDIERKNGVRTMIMNICRSVFEENADHINPIVLDVIFSHLISPEKANNPEAYHFMRKVLENGAVYIHQRILRIFVESCQTQDDPKLDTNVFKLVGKRRAAVYELLSELSEAIPDIRIDLLSLLSTKLTSSEMEVRLMALKTASEVAKNRSELPESCPTLWQRFVDRSKDGSSVVRKEFAERVRDLLYTHHDMRSTIWEVLARLVTDMDEEVRMAAIETVCLTARKKLEAVNERLIESCTERLRDKKTEVRKVALRHLLAMYKDIVRKEESTKSDRQSVATIAKRVLVMYRSDMQKGMTEEKVIIEKGLVCSILPMELPMRRRMELLVELTTRLNATEMKILQEMLQRVVSGRKLLSQIMDCISVKRDEEPKKEMTQEEKKKKTEACIEHLVKFFPNPQKAETALRKFTNLLCIDNEGVRQMEIILRKETTSVEAQTAVKLLLARVGSSRDEMSKEQEEMIRSLVSRLAPILIDHTSLLELSRYLREIIDGDSIGKEEAVKVINRAVSIYKILGELYPSNLNQREIIEILLSKFLESDSDFVVKSGLQCIHAMLSKEAGVDGVNLREERWRERMKEALIVQVKEGKPSCAKHALRDLCHLLGEKESWDALHEHLEGLMVNLDHREEETARSLVVLRKAVLAWKEPLLDKIMSIYPLEIARKILVPDPQTYDGGSTREVNACDFKTLEELPVSASMKNTLAAIKLAVRVLPLFPQGDHSTALISKTINVFSVCAFERGSVVENITGADAAWLSAMSGAALVRLMSNRRISREFATPVLMSSLAQVATHPLDSVRVYFINRIFKYYKAAPLTGTFVSLIPLSLMGVTRGVGSVEEEERARRHITDLFSNCLYLRHQSLHGKRIDDTMIKSELFVPHLVVLLAETPTLRDNQDEEELTKIAELLWQCVDPMAHKVRGSVNWEMVCALLNQLKTVLPRVKEKLKEDNDGKEEKEKDKKARMLHLGKKMWAVSEIFLHLIVYKAKIPMGTPEKNAPLLKGFFETRKGDNNEVYAPTSLLKRIEEGRIQHEFHKLKLSSSTMAKDETKKETKGRGRGRKKVVKKEEDSDEDMEEDEEDVKPSTSRRGQKVLDTLKEEEEEEDDEMEIDFEKKPSGSLRGKAPVNRRLTSMRELESIDLSPIGGTGPSRRGGLAASTPIVKNGVGRGGETPMDTTPKKRGRTASIPSVSPIKLSSKSPVKAPVNSPAKSPPKSLNGNRKRSSKKDEEEEEEEEEEKMPLPAKRGRGRSSLKKENGKEEEPKTKTPTSTKGRGKKKEEEKVEEKEEDTEKEEEEPKPKRGGRVPSQKKAAPPPPVRKTSSRKKK